MNLSRQKKNILWLCLCIALLTFMVYGQVKDHPFIDFDDYEYITENPHVRSGLNTDNIVWAFTSYHSNNWHPLTWISHMVDVQIFGLNPAGHHLVNVLFHIINTLLLLFLMRRMTGALWPSAFVAAIFALHPLHVESVAWAAERKDVLSTCFWLLTTWMYIRYTETPDWKRYIPVILMFALGLMAKQMLVTLPFVLLLLDYWPLGRMAGKGGHKKDAGKSWPAAKRQQASISRLIVEKIPLFALAVLAGIIVFIVQQQSGVLYSLTPFPFQIRLENALVSYVGYIVKMLCPVSLAVFYPHPLHSLALWKVLGAAGLLIAVSAATIWKGRRYPYLITGWFWYLGTLVPVIGLVQVGVQAMADRYTYIPLIGLFIMIAWGGLDLASFLARQQEINPEKDQPAGAATSPRKQKKPTPVSALSRAELFVPGRIVFGLTVAVLLILSFLTWRQVGYWRDNITLYSHAARVVPGNYWASNNLGAALASRGQIDAAMTWFAESLNIMPYYPGANQNMAAALYKQGRYEEAVPLLAKALKLQPRNPDLHVTLGAVLLKMGRKAEAATHFREALILRPGDGNAYEGLQEASPASTFPTKTALPLMKDVN
ncbi:MAG: tetratricopeptide repeat protein [Syntrophales bacterium]|nr:tetratricopeptide repeat protein [Syntrophales bacterium]